VSETDRERAAEGRWETEEEEEVQGRKRIFFTEGSRAPHARRSHRCSASKHPMGDFISVMWLNNGEAEGAWFHIKKYHYLLF
jgi:hypothetical protein